MILDDSGQKVFLTEFQVRGYELDGNGHVNHSVYLNYAEHARWEMLEQGSGSVDYFKKAGVAPVIVRAEVDYREACVTGEWLVIETVVLELKSRTARIRQSIKKKGTKKEAALVIVTAVCVNAEGKAVSMPEDFGKIFV